MEYPAGFILSGATLPEGDGLTLQEVSGQTIFYRASRSFPVGYHFWGAFQTRGIVNPAEPGRYLLRVSTSSDPTPVYLPYLVRPGGAVSAAAIAVTSVTAGQTSSYTFSFSPTTGVPEGGSVTLEFPAGFAPVVENSADGRYSVESVSGQTVTLRMLKAVEAWVYRPGMWYHGIETPGLSISAKNVVNPSVPGSYLFNIWTSNDTAKAAVSIVIYRPLLSISFAGSGNGSVNGGYSCLSPGVCSFTPMVPTVTLVPTPDADSIFAGWSGACTASSGSCEVVMDGNRHATATFNLVEKARFQGRPYQALTAAFAEQASGTVEARATEFAEALVVSAPKRLKGGFDRGFASNKGGLSVLKGSLVIRPGGSLIAEGLAIR